MWRKIKVDKSFLLGKTFSEFQKEFIRRHVKVRRDVYCEEDEGSCPNKKCCVIRARRIEKKDYYKLPCQNCCSFNETEHGINWAFIYGSATRKAWESLEAISKLGAVEIFFDFEEYGVPTAVISERQRQLFCIQCDYVKDASFIKKDAEEFSCEILKRKIA